MTDWTDIIVRDRMTVDQEFSERIRDSRFTSQEWGLIMTATELEIEHADDPERARLVADTGNLPQIMPELDNVRSQVPGAGAEGDGSGVVDSLKSALGLGNGDERLQAAERLTQEYADELQAHLEEKGKWERVRSTYAE